MDEDLFPERTERERMRRAPPTPVERLGHLARSIRRDGIAALRPRDTRLEAPLILQGQEAGGGTAVEVPVTDGRRHHPRSIQLCGWDPLATPFWANLVIAGDGIGQAGAAKAAAAVAKGTPVSKAEGSLPNAIRDLHSLRYFYNPHRVGDLDTVMQGSLMRSAGYFTHTVWLADPTEEAARTGIESICHWIDVNAGDPEFRSVQINIYFSGHGTAGHEPGESAILLQDGTWRVEDFVRALLDGLARRGTHGETCQVSLFIDSCHAGAIGRDFCVHLSHGQESRREALGFETIWCRTILCSSFADEQSFDEAGLGNSYFTAGFLHENSTRRAPASYPSLAEVSRRSEGLQTPFMLKFRSGESPEFRLPLLSWLTRRERAELLDADSVERGTVLLARESGRLSEDNVIDMIDWAICRGECIRNLALPRLLSDARRMPDIVPYGERRTRWDR